MKEGKSNAISFKTELERQLAQALDVAKAFQEAGRQAEQREKDAKALLSEVWGFAKSASRGGEPFICGCDACRNLEKRVEEMLEVRAT